MGISEGRNYTVVAGGIGPQMENHFSGEPVLSAVCGTNGARPIRTTARFSISSRRFPVHHLMFYGILHRWLLSV